MSKLTEKLTRLKEIEEQIVSSDIEKKIELYEEGVKLVKSIKTELNKLELKIKKIDDI